MTKIKYPKFTDQNGANFEVPVEGSLGLLALGAVGVKAWKLKRKEVGYKIQHINAYKPQPKKKLESAKPQKVESNE